MEARAGPAGLRHARDCHPRNRRLGPAGSATAPPLGEPTSGGWRLGGDWRPGPGGCDPRSSSFKIAFVTPSARRPALLTTFPDGWVVPAGGHAVSDAHNHPGGRPPRHAKANPRSSLIPERASIGSTKSSGDAARGDGPQHRLLDRRGLSVRARARLRHVGWRRQRELDLEGG